MSKIYNRVGLGSIQELMDELWRSPEKPQLSHILGALGVGDWAGALTSGTGEEEIEALGFFETERNHPYSTWAHQMGNKEDGKVKISVTGRNGTVLTTRIFLMMGENWCDLWWNWSMTKKTTGYKMIMNGDNGEGEVIQINHNWEGPAHSVWIHKEGSTMNYFLHGKQIDSEEWKNRKLIDII